MTHLVLGGTGFIGAHVSRRLVAQGCEVVVVHRGATAADLPPGVAVKLADRRDIETLRSLAQEVGARTVVDMYAITAAETRPVLDALDGLIDRYVLISSADVYRNYGGLLGREKAVPILEPLGEDAPLRQSRYPYRTAKPGEANQHPDLNDYDKIPIEEAVRGQDRFAWTILRLPMVYGPGDRQRRFAWIAWPLKERRAAIPLWHRIAAWRSTYGYVEDVAEAIALAASHQKAGGRTYNVGRADAPTQAEWVAKLARAADQELEIVELDALAGSALSQLAGGLDLDFPLVLDTRRIREELGFGEIIPEDVALRSTLHDEWSRPRPGAA